MISRTLRIRTTVVLGAALALTTACDTCQQVLLTRGNLDRVADVVVVNRADGSSIAITSNPELEALRVLDLTSGRFLEAPNRFSPLSVPTGPETRQLTLAVDVDGVDGVDSTRLYALDVSDDTVQIVRLEAVGAKPAFATVARYDVGGRPVDIAAIKRGDTTLVAVTLIDARVALFSLINDSVTPLDFVDVNAAAPGAALGAIVADPFGESFVVADVALPLVHVLRIKDDLTVELDRSLDVGGPVSRLAAGVVDVGDGRAPVVVALRSDVPSLMAVRLFRPGFREDRYVVLGGAELPSLPVETYVPDVRAGEPPETVCCRGLNDDALAANEATAAFATVWMANGDMVYVALAAERENGDPLPAGRRLVRLVDDDLAPLSGPEGIDLNSDENLWVPAPGGERFRPSVALTPVDNYGSPPFVPLVVAGTALLLTWEGDLPRLRNLGPASSNAWTPADLKFTVNRDVAARGARVGDVARFTQNDPDAACTANELRGVIVAVAGADVTLALGAEFAQADADACLGRNTDTVRVSIEAAGSFVVDNGGVFVGRLVAAGAGAEDSIALPGATLGFTASSAGLPLRGSKLAVPLDAHVTTMGMDLNGASNIGVAALIPTAIAGGALVIPDAASEVEGATTVARRMVFTSGSVNSQTGLPLLFTCDEGETSPGRVESFR